MFSVNTAAILLTFMFFVSGASKVCTLGLHGAERLMNKTGIPLKLSRFMVLVAGLFELISVYYILCGIRNKSWQQVDKGAMMLVAFTILVTFIFYANPLKKIFKPYPIMANMTAVGGLLLLPHVCQH